MATKTPLLTTKQVMAGFSVSDMTIYTWRQGSAARDKLPCHTEGNRVGFKATEMTRWAKKYGLTFDEAKAAAPVAEVKMGPKTTKAPAKKAAPVAKKSAAPAGKRVRTPSASVAA